MTQNLIVSGAILNETAKRVASYISDISNIQAAPGNCVRRLGMLSAGDIVEAISALGTIISTVVLLYEQTEKHKLTLEKVEAQIRAILLSRGISNFHLIRIEHIGGGDKCDTKYHFAIDAIDKDRDITYRIFLFKENDFWCARFE